MCSPEYHYIIQTSQRIERKTRSLERQSSLSKKYTIYRLVPDAWH